MKRVLFALFTDRQDALAARERLHNHAPPNPSRGIRLHEREFDLMLGRDLSGTETQKARERPVFGLFLAAFFVLAGIGFGWDLAAGLVTAGLPMTMGLGSLGVIVGTILVLRAAKQPLDHALTEAHDEMGEGRVLMTVPVEDKASPATAEVVSEHGGRLIFEA